ncbi:AAA family ATPase [Vibrio parahaemolyticus]|uniref:AAA family ATPase n=1 Tax=Vibrio parahaemolyticus TaxID=670 RepID=UPI0021603666|nr:AAA family ATPase [Vibrio parahaemolyticus]EHY8864286.1 AAA family ATPase [Vibrio parahaemolyticus]EII3128151.1 AAA family ATPase [Vibrio parahaemolyticus]EJG1505175.1 AAA family ATPase [Vibrio parahaemolyticus]MCS0070307.1 AAA family ATPase [Vibrio parahaemolyticus]MCS0262870.1 AAA family ATPase [Vibrio parahaemolyticus]
MGSAYWEKLVPQINPPKVPSAAEGLGIPASVVENLVLKHLAAYPKCDLVELTQRLCVVSNIVELALAQLRKRSWVEVYQPASDKLSHSYSNVRYSLTELGLAEADIAYRKDPYIGPVPVSLDDYWTVVEGQDLRKNPITRTDVERALSDVFGSERLIPVLGPAINSGRAMLLYGHAGTGKSYVAARVLNAMSTSVFIPYAIYADGNIIKVFSEHHHRRLDNSHSQVFVKLETHYDKRWVLCERPNIQVGGELTMDMLEVNHSEHNRVWIAPLQMMANNGILVIDDLGRQAMPVDALLNRWIVPMEYLFDHLALPNGQQVTVPFMLTLAFSSNFAPSKIADPAFLRRLGYKIEFKPLSDEDYHALWLSLSQDQQIALAPEFFDALKQLHCDNNMPNFPCLPKDLLGISRDILVFEGQRKVVSPDLLTRAWGLYFTVDE